MNTHMNMPHTNKCVHTHTYRERKTKNEYKSRKLKEILPNNVFGKGLIFRMCEELLKPNNNHIKRVDQSPPC